LRAGRERFYTSQETRRPRSTSNPFNTHTLTLRSFKISPRFSRNAQYRLLPSPPGSSTHAAAPAPGIAAAMAGAAASYLVYMSTRNLRRANAVALLEEKDAMLPMEKPGQIGPCRYTNLWPPNRRHKRSPTDLSESDYANIAAAITRHTRKSSLRYATSR